MYHHVKMKTLRALRMIHPSKLMADGTIVETGTYTQLFDSCKEFQNLVIALHNTSGSDNQSAEGSKQGSKSPNQESEIFSMKEQAKSSLGEQLIKHGVMGRGEELLYATPPMTQQGPAEQAGSKWKHTLKTY